MQSSEGQGSSCFCQSVATQSSSLSVQCDRIQPCTACALHQIADHCEFDLSEAERHPILQAEALKEKDKTIVQLRNELAVMRGDPIKSEPVDEVISFGQNGPKIKLPPRASAKKPTSTHKREYLGEMSANIYFGSPGMTSVVEEVSVSDRTHPPHHTTESGSSSHT